MNDEQKLCAELLATTYAIRDAVLNGEPLPAELVERAEEIMLELGCKGAV